MPKGGDAVRTRRRLGAALLGGTMRMCGRALQFGRALPVFIRRFIRVPRGHIYRLFSPLVASRARTGPLFGSWCLAA